MEQNTVTQAPATPPATNNKLTSCKTCGAQIAKSAKKCPSCGAKNKSGKSLVKLLIPLVIIGILAALYISKTLDINATKAVLYVNGTEYSWGDYKDIYHDYYLNGKSIDFQNEFLPAEATITGEITKISDAIIGETMKGNMPTKNTLMKFEITIDDGCTYSVIYNYYDQNDYDFSHLAVGDTVTVKGTVTEDELFDSKYIPEYLDAQLKIVGTAEGIVEN